MKILAVLTGLITLIGFQNCSQTMLYGNFSYSFPGYHLDHTFVMGSSSTWQIFNNGFTPSRDVFIDAQNGNDSNPGTSSQPLKTIPAAQSMIKQIKSFFPNRQIQANLKGVFYLTNPLIFTSDDSGYGGGFIIYKNWPGFTATISGGTPLPGNSFVSYGNQNNIYRAPVPQVPFRNLFVNGQRANLAKSISPLNNSVLSTTTNYVECQNCQLPPTTTPVPVEIVSVCQWQSALCPGVLNPDSSITPDTQCWQQMLSLADFVEAGVTPHITWLQNSPLFMKNPGDWALDTSAGYVYYIPRLNEVLQNSEIIIPQLTQLIEGTNLDHVAFIGITFSHTDWEGASTVNGYRTLQADILYPNAQELPAAISCLNCTNVLFADSRFKHIGSAALSIGGNSSNNLIFHNTFTDISASALQIADTSSQAASDADFATTNTAFQDNSISDIGLEYFGSPAIFQGYAAFSVIDHNEIHDTPYTGISVGWGWTETPSANSHDNSITANLIYNGMQILQDGGGIYTLSRQDGTLIAHNYIHDMGTGLAGVNRFTFSNGVYLDNGSSYITVTSNTLEQIPTNNIFQNAPNIGNQILSDGTPDTTIEAQAGPRQITSPP